MALSPLDAAVLAVAALQTEDAIRRAAPADRPHVRARCVLLLRELATTIERADLAELAGDGPSR